MLSHPGAAFYPMQYYQPKPNSMISVYDQPQVAQQQPQSQAQPQPQQSFARAAFEVAAATSVQKRDKSETFDFVRNETGSYSVTLAFKKDGPGRLSLNSGAEVDEHLKQYSAVFRRASELIVSGGSQAALARLEGGAAVQAGPAFGAQASNMMAQLQELQGQLTESNTQLKTFRTAIGSLRNEKKELEQKNQTQLLHIGSLEQKVRELEQALTASKQQAPPQPPKPIAVDSAQLDAVQKQCAALTHRLNEARMNANNFQMEIKRAAAEKLELQKKIDAEKEEVATYRGMSSRLSQQAVTISEQLREAERKIANLERELAGASQRVIELTKMIETSTMRQNGYLAMATEAVVNTRAQFAEQIEIERAKKDRKADRIVAAVQQAIQFASAADSEDGSKSEDDDDSVNDDDSSSSSSSSSLNFVLEVAPRVTVPQVVCQKAPRPPAVNVANEAYLAQQAEMQEQNHAEPSIFDDDQPPIVDNSGNVDFTDAEIAMMAPRRSETPDFSIARPQQAAADNEALDALHESEDSVQTKTSEAERAAAVCIDLNTPSASSSSASSFSTPETKPKLRTQSEPSKKHQKRLYESDDVDKVVKSKIRSESEPSKKQQKQKKRSHDSDDDVDDKAAKSSTPLPKARRDQAGQKVSAGDDLLGRFLLPPSRFLDKKSREQLAAVSEALEAIGMVQRSEFPHKSDGTTNIIVVSPGMTFATIMATYGVMIVRTGAYVIHLDKFAKLLDSDGGICDGVAASEDDDATLTPEAALNIVKRAAFKPRSAERIRRVRFVKGRFMLDATWASIWSTALQACLSIVDPVKPKANWNHPENDGDDDEKMILLYPTSQRELIDMLRAECRFADDDNDMMKKEEFATLKENDEKL